MIKRGLSLATVIMLIATVFILPAASLGDENKDWPMMFGNAQGNCVSEKAGPKNPNLELAWSFESYSLKAERNLSRLQYPFAANGYCFVQDEDCTVHKIDIASGNSEVFITNNCYGNLKCMFDDKMIFVRKGDPMNRDKAKRSNIITCIGASSREFFWEAVIPEGFNVRSNVIFDETNLYFIGTGASVDFEIRAYAIRKDDGSITWQESIITPFGVKGNQLDFTGPIICRDSKSSKLVFAYFKREGLTEDVSFNDSKIVSLILKTGYQYWTTLERDTTIPTLSCGFENIVYTHKKGVVCLNSENGTKRWTSDENFDLKIDTAQPLIYFDKVCIIKNSTNTVICKWLFGGDVWRVKLQNTPGCVSYLTNGASSKDYLFFGDSANNLNALEVWRGNVCWTKPNTNLDSMLPDHKTNCTLADDSLLVLSSDGKLRCYGEGKMLEAAKIVITPENPVVVGEERIKFEAKVFDVNGNEIPCARVTWDLKNRELGNIYEDGEFNAKYGQFGETEVIATCGKIKTATKVTVKKNYRILIFPEKLVFNDFGNGNARQYKKISIENMGSCAVDLTISGETSWCKMTLESYRLRVCSQIDATVAVDSTEFKPNKPYNCILTLDFDGEYKREIKIEAIKSKQ